MHCFDSGRGPVVPQEGWHSAFHRFGGLVDWGLEVSLIAVFDMSVSERVNWTKGFEK